MSIQFSADWNIRLMQGTYHFEAVDVVSIIQPEQMQKTHPLKFIIHSTPYILMGIAYNTHHPFGCLTLVKPKGKSIPQPFDRRLAFEGRQTSAKHQLHS